MFKLIGVLFVVVFFIVLASGATGWLFAPNSSISSNGVDIQMDSHNAQDLLELVEDSARTMRLEMALHDAQRRGDEDTVRKIKTLMLMGNMTDAQLDELREFLTPISEEDWKTVDTSEDPSTEQQADR
jgi:hypothetical protein